MAGKLTSGQRAGLLFGGAILTALLIVGKAEGAFDGLLEQKSQPKTKFPAKGQPKGQEPPVPQVELSARAPQTKVVIAEGCDPLADYPYPMICFPTEDNKWALLPALNRYPNDTTLPKITARQIGVSNDFSAMKIGTSWIFGKLHPFLNQLRKDEVFAVSEDEFDFDLTEELFTKPANFLNETFGTEHAGGITMAILYVVASGGLGAKAALVYLPGLATPIAVGSTSSAVIGHVAALGKAGALISSSEFLTPDFIQDPIFSYLGGLFSEESPTVAASALEAFGRVLDKFQVIHGDQPNMYLKQLPVNGFPAMEKLMSDIMKAILDFQARKFTWDDGGTGQSHWPTP